jgi:hypothetical protein
MNTKTNYNTQKLASLLIALLMVFNVGTITVFAGTGDGTGGGNGNNPLNLVSVRYSTGSGYDDLDDASFSAGAGISGYIRFDRGMTTYSSNNFTSISLEDDGGDTYLLNLRQAPSDITDGGVTIEKKHLYTFSVSNLPAGSYTLTLGTGIRANNGQYLTGAPITIEFSVV